MTTIGVEPGSFFALSAEPGAVNVGSTSIACRSDVRVFDWPVLALLGPLLDVLGALEPELQAASASAPAVSSTPTVAGLVTRESLAMRVRLMSG
jgi:hypothetical protein